MTPTDPRRDELDRRLQMYAAGGWRVENRTEYQATIVRGKNHSHGLHLALTILTAGVWGLVVWLPLSVFGGLRRRMVSVQGDGSVLDQKV